MSGYIIDCRAKQSFPLFWVFGSLGGLGFAFAGGFIIHGYMSLNHYEREGGMIAAGIAFLIMGVLLLAGVVFTLIKTADPNDLSFKVDMDQARGNRKYDPNKLVNYIETGHNNIILFNAAEGQMHVFGSKGKIIVEICIVTREGGGTYHLTDPYVTGEEPVIVENIFFERFPVRKNRVVNKEQAVRAIEMLYASQSLTEVARSLPFVNSTEETNRLIEKDAYIIPSVPLKFPKKQKDKDRAIKENEEREKRAMQELNIR